MAEKKITIGDIVRKTNSYWQGEIGEPPLSEEEKEELYLVVAISRLGCEIKNIKTGKASAWWSFDCLELAENKGEKVNHPSHYCKAGRKECIVEMEEKYGIPATVGFCLMNAYKYLYRAWDKDNNSYEQDIKKASWYFDYANKLLEKTDKKDCFKENSDLYLDIKDMLENE